MLLADVGLVDKARRYMTLLQAGAPVTNCSYGHAGDN